MHIVEGAVPGGIVGDRAGKQLVPAGELRTGALHVQRILGAEANVGALISRRHQFGAARMHKQRHLLGFQQARQLVVQGDKCFTHSPVTALRGVLHQIAAFLQFQADRHSAQVLLFQLMTESGERVEPGLDTKPVVPGRRDLELALPAVVTQAAHYFALPALIGVIAPAHAHREPVMTVGKHLARHGHHLPFDGLDRKLAAIDHGRGVLDRNAWQQQRL
ncbi:hypothetical protein D3C84_484530 [compost metagenome]